jgi:thioredoxin-like negative regulator of GroEL
MHLAVVIAIDPETPNAYLRLARILHERGEREAALAVLETGWKHRQRDFRHAQRATEKARYFAVLDQPLPVSDE